MSITRRKKVPYSKNYLFRDPDLPLAHLYFGPSAWNAKDDINNRSVLLPPGEAPQNYDWRFLTGHIVIAHALGVTEHDYRKRLAYELLLAGARQVHVFLPPVTHAENRQITLSPSNDALAATHYWSTTPHERYYR